MKQVQKANLEVKTRAMNSLNMSDIDKRYPSKVEAAVISYSGLIAPRVFFYVEARGPVGGRTIPK